MLLQLIPSDTEAKEQKKRGGWLKRSLIPLFMSCQIQIRAYTSRPHVSGVSKKAFGGRHHTEQLRPCVPTTATC